MDEEQALPFEASSEDFTESALDEVIRLYIAPEGSEFGLSAEALASKERVVRKQIASGTLKIITDPGAELTVLMTSQDWRALKSKFPQ